jgi:hypothetical protein
MNTSDTSGMFSVFDNHVNVYETLSEENGLIVQFSLTEPDCLQLSADGF